MSTEILQMLITLTRSQMTAKDKLLIHFGEAIYKYLYNKRTLEDRFKYGGYGEHQKSILRIQKLQG